MVTLSNFEATGLYIILLSESKTSGLFSSLISGRQHPRCCSLGNLLRSYKVCLRAHVTPEWQVKSSIEFSPGEFMASWVRWPPLDDQALEQELDGLELERVTTILREQQEQQRLACAGGDVELQESEDRLAGLPQCYQEIKTLMWIERSVVHQKALDEWERKSTLLTARVERKRKLGWNQRNEIYNLVGFFSVFQGVLLTAVSQSNLLHCNNWWSPFTLSVLASLVTFVGVYQKFSYIWSLDRTISSEENTLKAVVKRVNALRRLGIEFRFADSEETRKRPEHSRFTVYTFLVFAALASFAVVFAVSHPVILCHSGCNPVNSCT